MELYYLISEIQAYFTFNICRVLGNPSRDGYSAFDSTTYFVFGAGGKLDMGVILESITDFVDTFSSKASFRVRRKSFSCNGSHIIEMS
jgi:hypothetical protein